MNQKIKIKWGIITDYDFSKSLNKDVTKGEIKVTPKEWIKYCLIRSEFISLHYKMMKHIRKSKKRINVKLDRIQKEINEEKL